MSREKELEQALGQLINQTDEAIDGGYVFTSEYKSQLDDAREVLSKGEKTKERSTSDPYPEHTPDFNVVMN